MALTETLTDNFSGGISASWSTSLNSANSAEVTSFNGAIKVAHTAASEYNALAAATTYDLTSSYFYVKTIDYGNQSLASHESIIGSFKDSGNNIWMSASGGQLAAFKKVATVQSQIGGSISLDYVNHVWRRIRESGGTIFFDTAPDVQNAPGAWTNRWSVANPFAITAVTPQLQCGNYNAESVGSQSVFDNFNIAGELPPIIGTYNPGQSWTRRFAKNKRQLFPWYFNQGLADIPQQMNISAINPGQTWSRRFQRSKLTYNIGTVAVTASQNNMMMMGIG